MKIPEESWQHIADEIARAERSPFAIEEIMQAGGGCISSAFIVRSKEQQYFVKTNEASRLEMFATEAAGLGELRRANAIRVPRAICWGNTGACSFLVLEYIELRGSSVSGQALLGRQLAQLHRTTGDRHGWDADNFIGATPQKNQWCDDWQEFFATNRLGYQIDTAMTRGFPNTLKTLGDRLISGLDKLFEGYRPVPSLLHGDLWSGNYGMDSAGRPVIFDPAVYYGDRESDLAMTELFGGFSADFYTAYEEEWPLDPGYSARKPLYQLYHVLNHANLFGGGYVNQAESMMTQLVAVVEC